MWVYRSFEAQIDFCALKDGCCHCAAEGKSCCQHIFTFLRRFFKLIAVITALFSAEQPQAAVRPWLWFLSGLHGGEPSGCCFSGRQQKTFSQEAEIDRVAGWQMTGGESAALAADPPIMMWWECWQSQEMICKISASATGRSWETVGDECGCPKGRLSGWLQLEAAEQQA